MRPIGVYALLLAVLAPTAIATPTALTPRDDAQPYSASGYLQHDGKSFDYAYTSNSVSTSYNKEKQAQYGQSASAFSSSIQCEKNEQGGTSNCNEKSAKDVSDQRQSVYEVESGQLNESTVVQAVVYGENMYEEKKGDGDHPGGEEKGGEPSSNSGTGSGSSEGQSS